jgi:hypothetical protein
MSPLLIDPGCPQLISEKHISELQRKKSSKMEDIKHLI